MKPENWDRLKMIFHKAVAMRGQERDQFIAEACAGDPELFQELIKVLEGHEAAGEFLSTSPADLSRIAESPPLFQPEQVIAGRFRVIRFISHGGMGEVYEAEDLVLEERVALKTILPRAAREDRLALLKQEIQSARRVTHPNVCRIHDFVEHGDPPLMLLTMELLKGPTLSQYLKEHGPFSRRAALPLVQRIAAGLQSAHDSGVVHRDFKPGNVILLQSPGGQRPVITDFGLAFSPGSGQGREPIRAGTPGYMAPEQLDGGQTTPATDVYALGVVIAEMIGCRRSKELPTPSGKHFFTVDEKKELGPWRRVLERCLEKSPVDRYRRPIDVATALQRRQRQKQYFLALSILATLATLSLLIYWRSASPGRSGAGFVTRYISDEGEKFQFFSVSPDGQWIAARDEQSGNLVLCDFKNGKTRWLTHRPATVQASVWGAVFSPDCKTVAYLWAAPQNQDIHEDIRLVGIDGRNDRLLFKNPSANVSLADWSAHGSNILIYLSFRDHTTQLASVSVTTGSLTVLTAPSMRGLDHAIFSPDGKELWFDTIQEGENISRGIFARALAGGQEHALVADQSNNYLAGVSADGRYLAFVSDRTGRYGLWVMHVTGASHSEPPELRVDDIGSIGPLGMTRNGGLYHVLGTGFQTVYVAELDLKRRTTISGPRNVVKANLFGAHRFPSWSANGEELSFIGSKNRSDPLLAFYSTTSHAVRELPIRLNSLNRPQWRTSHSIVGFGVGEGKVGYFEIDSRTGDARLLIDAETVGTRFEGVWSSDGNMWYNRFGQWKRGLFRYSFRDRKTEKLFVPKPGTEMGLENLALSPDGRTLAFQIRDQQNLPGYDRGTLMLLDTRGGEPRPLWSARRPDAFLFGAFTWLPDSKALLVARTRGEASELWLVPINGAAPEKIEFPAVSIRNLRMNRDGKTIAFHSGQMEMSELRVIENFLPSH